MLVETVTTHEPEWDETDRALIDAYLNWQADLHSCGRPRSESLYDPDRENDPDYQVADETCLGCMALDAHHARQAGSAKWKELREAGRNPDSWTDSTVMPLSEVPEPARSQILAAREKRSTASGVKAQKRVKRRPRLGR